MNERKLMREWLLLNDGVAQGTARHCVTKGCRCVLSLLQKPRRRTITPGPSHASPKRNHVNS